MLCEDHAKFEVLYQFLEVFGLQVDLRLILELLHDGDEAAVLSLKDAVAERVMSFWT